jgi:hypothetical protein
MTEEEMMREFRAAMNETPAVNDRVMVSRLRMVPSAELSVFE